MDTLWLRELSQGDFWDHKHRVVFYFSLWMAELTYYSVQVKKEHFWERWWVCLAWWRFKVSIRITIHTVSWYRIVTLHSILFNTINTEWSCIFFPDILYKISSQIKTSKSLGEGLVGKRREGGGWIKLFFVHLSME